MDRLGLLKTLIMALDEGSLSRAAHKQGITQSAASQQLRQLEQALGHQLLTRTTSGVRATRAGLTTAKHARHLLSTYDTLEDDLRHQNGHLSGTYRISVGTILGRTVFGTLMLSLNQKFPDIDIVMGAEDRYVDVVRENYDLAIRAGKIGDSDGFGRKIAQLDTVLVATPSYLNQHARPHSVSDLMDLKFIRYNMESTSSKIRLKENGLWQDAPVNIGFTAGDPQVMMQALETGVGFAKVVRILIEDKLADGSLEQILPDVDVEQKDIFAVYPSRNGLDKCQQAVVDGFLEIVAARQSNTSTLKPPQAPKSVLH